MKKLKKMMTYIIAASLGIMPLQTLAYEGEMGYFGGVTPGKKLPTMISLAAEKSKNIGTVELPYQENIYLTGKPITVTGTLTFKPVVLDDDEEVGDYKESYIIEAEDVASDSKVTRTVTLETSYVYNPLTKQTTKTSEVTNWSEIVKVEGETYQLDEDASTFSKSILEEATPGVMYYSGDVIYQAVYKVLNGEDGEVITLNNTTELYGYDHVYAKTETQKRKIQIDAGGQQFYIEEMPTYTTNKELQYSSNEPEAMSFEGNYREINRGTGSLVYQIIRGDYELFDHQKQGGTQVVDTPSVEQLGAVDLSHLKGHPGEWDAKKLYSLGILKGNPKAFSPNLAVTKGDFVKLLVDALRIPLPEEKKGSRKKSDEDAVVVFTDLTQEDSFYPYAMAAYEAGLLPSGKANPGKYLTREEMYTLIVRAIGLEQLGIGADSIATPYVDDANISPAYKNSIYAASRINLIPMNNGYFFPQSTVRYMDAVTVLVDLLDYLRHDLQKDYAEKMI